MSTAAPPRSPSGPRARRGWSRRRPGPPEPFPLGRRARLPGRRELDPRLAATIVGLLLLAAVAIRLAIPRGIWLDEAISIHQAHLSLPALIQDLAHTDRHPPLHHIVLWLVHRLAGDGDLAMRVPSIAAGAALVPVVYRLGSELFDRRTGLVAALLATVSPILVWYSQEARGYALEALFATLAVLGCVRAIQRGRRRDWALHAVASALAVWTHWFALFVVLATEALLLSELVRRRRLRDPLRAWVTGWGLSTLALVGQLVPLGVLAAAQVQATGTSGGYAGAASSGGDGVSFYTTVANVSWALFGFHPDDVTRALSAIWPLLMLAALVVMGRGASRRAAVLLACALAPVVALLVLGVASPDVFDVRYFVAAVPAALVLFARLATSWPRTGASRLVVAGALALVLGVGLADQQLNPDNPRRYDFREALARTQAQMGPRDVLLYEPPELRFVLDHYAPDVVARPLDGRLPSREQAPGLVVLASFLDQERYKAVVDRQVGALRATRAEGPPGDLPGVTLRKFR